MIRWSFRRATLCPGRNCPESREIRDEAGRVIDREPCWTCPDVRLDEAMGSRLGRLAHAAFDLETALEMKVQVAAADIPAPVWRAVKMVREERIIWEEEQRRK